VTPGGANVTTIAFDIEVAGFPWLEVDEITRGSRGFVG